MKNPCNLSAKLNTSNVDYAISMASFLIAVPFIYGDGLASDLTSNCFYDRNVYKLGKGLVRKNKTFLHNIEDVDDSDIKLALKVHIQMLANHHDHTQISTTCPLLEDSRNDDFMRREAMAIINNIRFDKIRQLIEVSNESYRMVNGKDLDTKDVNEALKNIEDAYNTWAIDNVKRLINNMVVNVWKDAMPVGDMQDYVNDGWNNPEHHDDFVLAYRTKEAYIAAVYEAIHNGPATEWM